jgi:hypothetical protein
MNGMIEQRGFGPGPFGTALFFGALWGLGEAGLGHVLHLAHVPGLPGLVMVSWAVLVMGRVASRSRSNAAGAVFLAGVVAAALKLLDLFVPGTELPAVINPIQAILLEALAGAVWVRFHRQERGTVPVRGQSQTERP